MVDNVDKNAHSHHISQQFNEELDEVKTRMMEMGGLVEKQLVDGIASFIHMNNEEATVVIKADNKINDLEVEIDESCTRILARRQPAASDLRLLISITKAVNDLERVGDEAAKIAKQVTQLDPEDQLSDMSRGQTEVRHIGKHVGGMLRDSLDAFARMDAEKALQVALEDKSVDREYASAMRSLVTYMMEDPRSITRMLAAIWCLRSLERVGDHARNIAEHVIYLVKGTDVRHIGLKKMTEEVHEIR